MKKRIFSVIVSVLAIFSAAVLIQSAMSDRSLAKSNDMNPPPAYIVRDYNGWVAVFPYASDNPQTVTGVSVAILPERDQNMLERGISVYSDDELFTLLEDYDAY